MQSLRYVWERYRLTFLIICAAIVFGGLLGVLSEIAITLPPPKGNRPTFYLEMFLLAVGIIAWLMIWLVRADLGLVLLLFITAFLPSRTGMQFHVAGIPTAVSEVLSVLLFLMLIVGTKILKRQIWQPVPIRMPMWLWAGMGVVGLLVSFSDGVPFNNWIVDLKGFYIFLLLPIAVVNIVQTPAIMKRIMVVYVLSQVPNVYFQFKDTGLGGSAVGTTLSNGQSIIRSSGGSGAINQYAFAIMVAFFLSIGLFLTYRHLLPRLIFAGSAVLLFIGIGLTYTRGAWIATALGVVVFATLGGRRMLMGTIVTGIVAYALIPSYVWDRLTFNDGSVATRVSYIHTATAAIKAFPLLGGGWGSNFADAPMGVVPAFSNGVPFWHDDYLIVATQVGLTGLVIFLSMLGMTFWIGIKTAWKLPQGESRTLMVVLIASLTAMCFQASTEMFFWNPEDAPVIWMVVGMVCALVNWNTSAPKRRVSLLNILPRHKLGARQGAA